MGSSKGRKEEDALRQAALASQVKAEAPDPFEQRRRDHVLSMDKWRKGESGAIDVRNMPGGAVPLALFKEAKASRDAGRVGRGLGTLSDGANPNFTAALDKENQIERDLNAAGMLESHVDDTLAGVDAEMTGLANTGNARNMAMYEMALKRLMDFQRNKQPSFLKQMALGGISGLSGLAMGGLFSGGDSSSKGGSSFGTSGKI